MAFITEIIILNGIKIHDPKKPNPIKIRPPLLNSAIHLNTHHLRMPHLHHWLMLAAALLLCLTTPPPLLDNHHLKP
jgi:hypothetical protein